ncbi:NUDIX hydrolase [Compostimonas suwonensis]|uniref:ADP-ribose pyrophosphatase YjhB (NUDIX family) n=1 Tax=Compostimonas suwonensis TaxID=1048394 RepID=A0A2M9BWB8_9MICO|nr:NUDIX domain-containing protein [Compostimonas suwonensis]PJJ62240.1 ADP-ribose pyrophosphatase YjhB (NUDIX family) [Compostimonas suwonensis]
MPGTTASAATHETRETPISAPVILAVSTVIFALRPNETGPATVWIPLVRRIREPFEGLWAIPGGALRADEDLASAARRTLEETSGLTPRYLEQLYAFGSVDRAPGTRVVSIVYWALVRSEEAAKATESENVRWFSTDELPTLAFDHNEIVAYALWRLRTKMEYSRIAHAFLGDTFTLAQLREVHEAVLQRPLDPANFRRMIEASKTVVDTGQRVTGTRHRPPRLYRYDSSIDLADVGPLSSI